MTPVQSLAVRVAGVAIFTAVIGLGAAQREWREDAASRAVPLPIAAADDAAIDRILREEHVPSVGQTKMVPLIGPKGRSYGAAQVVGAAADLARTDAVLGREGNGRAGAWQYQIYVPVGVPEADGRRRRVAGVSVDVMLWRPHRFAKVR